MTIKYIVISGGGPTGIKALGALQYLEKNDFWKLENIKTIYATSAGSIVATLIALNFQWEDITDYILLRPWHDVYNIQVHYFFEAFSKKGLFDEKVFHTFFSPFFKAKDLSTDITLREFYEYTKIDVHFFSLELNNFEIVDVSHKTHPELPLLEAIHMTAALPIIISPCCRENKCYIDGGVVCNYPLEFCIKNEDIKEDQMREILGLRNDYELEENENNIVNHQSTILDYIMNFINKLIQNVDTERKQISIPNELRYKTKNLEITFLKNAVSSPDVRRELLFSGFDHAKLFLSQHQKSKVEIEEKDKEI